MVSWYSSYYIKKVRVTLYKSTLVTKTLISIPAAGATFTAYELSMRAFQANGW